MAQGMNEILVYGLASGETERYTEQLLATSCQTQADIEKVMTAAAKDGFHSFRTAIFREGERPDFARAVFRTPNTASKKYYAICHRKDGVNGSSVAVGGIMAGEDLDSLSERLGMMIWRRSNRPTIARIYLTSTEELVREIKL